MLQATPAIAGMKMENPHCKITVLVEKQFEDICRYLPNIDEVLSIDLGMTVRALAREGEGIIDAYEYLSETVELLQSRKFDYCLNMSSSAYTALLLRLVGIERSGGWTSDEEGFRVIESEWARLFATSVFHQNRQYNSLNLVDVFRSSADVDLHPRSLLMNVEDEYLRYADRLIQEAGFTNTGPLITLQAGASQQKRQWLPNKFIALAKTLIEKHNARVILTGSGKESEIINPIVQGVNSPNCISCAGKTTVPQLGAVIKRSSVLITGDTGPMHIAVGVGTPVIAMFLASAFGFETGPYSEGNIVLQPIISCGPCNPNKPCARPDCHDHIDPDLIATLAIMRIQSNFKELPAGMFDPTRLMIYRSEFDAHGFLDLRPLGDDRFDGYKRYRAAYRRLWLEELSEIKTSGGIQKESRLIVAPEKIEGLDEIIEIARKGKILLDELVRLIQDPHSVPKLLGEVNSQVSELDRIVEERGFQHPHLGPLTRMFVFAKENLSGTEAVDLASQMGRVYEDLGRRAAKLSQFYHAGGSDRSSRSVTTYGASEGYGISSH